VVDDHRTLAWIVSPMVPGMSAELVELATDQVASGAARRADGEADHLNRASPGWDNNRIKPHSYGSSRCPISGYDKRSMEY